MAEYNILLIPIWIPTRANQLANNLSRFRYRKIADMYPQLGYLNTPLYLRVGTHLNHSTVKPRCRERPHAFSGRAYRPKPAVITTPQSSPTEYTVH